MKTPRVGFIGLGSMGMGMARNLHAAGWLSIVWNRTRERAAALAGQLGIAIADDPTALARGAECIGALTDTDRTSQALEFSSSKPDLDVDAHETVILPVPAIIRSKRQNAPKHSASGQ